MESRCGWCQAPGWLLPAGDGLTLVGVMEAGSGPGWAVHACQPCRVWHGIVPASQHPAGWLGEVRYVGAGR